jgi:DNA primase small subunit
MQSNNFVERMFQSYYEDNSVSVNGPSMIEKREFGFVSFTRGMIRHKGFGSKDGLQEFLRSMAPSDAYYSCAYYDDPEGAMEKKGWSGADLIFDIDADHILTSCNKIHDEWTCESCQLAGKGVTPRECPICGGARFTARTWLCHECLDSAKAETVKLLDMLERDFGFGEKEVHVFFSGHRGYHVHVESTFVKELDSVARKEIVDYVIGLGFDTGVRSLARNWLGEAGLRDPLRPGDLTPTQGWLGRLAVGIYDFILKAKQDDLVEMGVKKKIAETLLQNRALILKRWNPLGIYPPVKGLGPETWKRIAEFCVSSISAHVDTIVTTDVHRLIRLTDSLHGKTGLKKVEFPVATIEVFDPFKSPIAFKGGTAAVFVSDVPEFRLGDETFGPYNGCRVELPIAAALLLVCKGRAEIVSYDVS